MNSDYIDAAGYVAAYQPPLMEVDVESASHSRSSSSKSGYRSPRSCLESSSRGDDSNGHDGSNEDSGGSNEDSGDSSNSNDLVFEGEMSPDSNDNEDSIGSNGESSGYSLASSSRESPESHLSEQLLSALDYFERQQTAAATAQHDKEQHEKWSTRRAAREQRRSGKIVSQIDALAHMLEEAGTSAPAANVAAYHTTRATSKASVLTAVVEYIRLMEERNVRLQAEHAAIVSKMEAMALEPNHANQLATQLHHVSAANRPQQHQPPASLAAAAATPPAPAPAPAPAAQWTVPRVSHHAPPSMRPPPQISPVSSSDDSVSEADSECSVFGASSVFQRPSRNPDYKLLFMHSPVPMAVCGVDGKFAVCNDLFTAALETTAEKLKGGSLFALAEDPPALHAAVQRMAASPEAIPTAELPGALPASKLLVSFIRPASVCVPPSLTVCLSSAAINRVDLEDHAVVVG